MMPISSCIIFQVVEFGNLHSNLNALFESIDNAKHIQLATQLRVDHVAFMRKILDSSRHHHNDLVARNCRPQADFARALVTTST